jgi:hypothetical protein
VDPAGQGAILHLANKDKVIGVAEQSRQPPGRFGGTLWVTKLL